MSRIVSLLSAACLAGLTMVGPTHAQEEEEAEGSVEELGGAVGSAPGLVGAPTPAPEAGGPTIVGSPAGPQVESTEFEDWRVECYDPPVNNMKCQIVQQLVERNLEQVVLVTSLAYLPATEQTQIQMVLPLGFLLKRGVTFDVSGYTTSVGVDRCTQQGCFIEGIAAPELLGAMRRGREAQISIVADSGQTVRIPFSLMGFTAAYGMMEEENRAAVAALAAAEDEEADAEEDSETGEADEAAADDD